MIELTKEYIDHLKDIITEKDDAKIKEILEKYSELGIDAKVAEDYINVLLNYKPKEKQEDISDDDFFKKFEEMRKKN